MTQSACQEPTWTTGDPWQVRAEISVTGCSAGFTVLEVSRTQGTLQCLLLSGSSSAPHRWWGCALYWAPVSPTSSDRLPPLPPPSDIALPAETHTHTKLLSHSAVPQRTEGDVLWSGTRITGRLLIGLYFVLVYWQMWGMLAAVQVHKGCPSGFLRCTEPLELDVCVSIVCLFVDLFAVEWTMDIYRAIICSIYFIQKYMSK